MNDFLNNLTDYQVAAFMVAFLMVGVPLIAIGFERLGNWLYEKFRRWD